MTIEEAFTVLKSNSADLKAVDIVESALNDYHTILEWLVNENSYYDEFLRWCDGK